MLATLEDRTIDFFEYALDIIELYDEEYEKKRGELDLHNKKSGKKLDFASRLDIVRDDFHSILSRHVNHAYEYSKEMQIVKFSETYSEYMNSELIVPLKDNIYFVYSMTSNNISIVFKKVADTKFVKYFLSQFNQCKLVVHDTWMRLDFDEDGQVTLQDIKENLKQAYAFVQSLEWIQNCQEFKSNCYKRALEYMRNDIAKEKAQ